MSSRLSVFWSVFGLGVSPLSSMNLMMRSKHHLENPRGNAALLCCLHPLLFHYLTSLLRFSAASVSGFLSGGLPLATAGLALWTALLAAGMCASCWMHTPEGRGSARPPGHAAAFLSSRDPEEVCLPCAGLAFQELCLCIGLHRFWTVRGRVGGVVSLGLWRWVDALGCCSVTEPASPMCQSWTPIVQRTLGLCWVGALLVTPAFLAQGDETNCL